MNIFPKKLPPPANPMYLKPEERYALGLLCEEAGETQQLIGKTLRFGIDAETPYGSTNRQLLELELGDLLASIDYAIYTGLVDWPSIRAAADRKYDKLHDPDSKDHQGRKLTP